jgi:hypothetical protein
MMCHILVVIEPLCVITRHVFSRFEGAFRKFLDVLSGKIPARISVTLFWNMHKDKRKGSVIKRGSDLPSSGLLQTVASTLVSGCTRGRM